MNNQQLMQLRESVQNNKLNFFKEMPPWANGERLIRIGLDAVKNNEKLMACNVRSIALALQESWRAGLEVNTQANEAYLIPRGQTCCFEAHYQGLLKLASKIPEVGPVKCGVKHAKDQLVYKEVTDGEVFEYTQYMGEEPGVLEAAWARYFHMPSKQWITVVVPGWKIKKRHMAHSKGHNHESSPWQQHPEAMWIKSAIRELYKIMPKSTAMSAALSADISSMSGDPVQSYDITKEVDVAPSAKAQDENLDELEPIDA